MFPSMGGSPLGRTSAAVVNREECAQPGIRADAPKAARISIFTLSGCLVSATGLPHKALRRAASGRLCEFDVVPVSRRWKVSLDD